jgi:hypothetical protein
MTVGGWGPCKKPLRGGFLLYNTIMSADSATNVDHKKWSVVLAFAFPIILILGVLFSSSAPFWQAKTDYDFVYAICNMERERYYTDQCQSYLLDVIQVNEAGQFYRGAVNPNRDSDQDGVLDKDESYKIRFFYHDSEANISREITEDELGSYKLSPLLSSPDGATVTYDYRGSPDVLFVDVGANGYEYRLVQGNRSKTLNLIDGTEHRFYRNHNFSFVGWIMN